MGRGLRASGSELGNPARPPRSPLSAATAKPPDAASQGPAAQGSPTGRSLGPPLQLTARPAPPPHPPGLRQGTPTRRLLGPGWRCP